MNTIQSEASQQPNPRLTTPTIYGYARVSSRGQQLTGTSLESQEAELRARGCTQVVTEAYTGASLDRPVFQSLLSQLQPGDTLCVTRLDRLSRTAADGALMVRDLNERGIIIDIGNIGRVDNTPIGKFTVLMLLAIAEFEKDQILERFADGKRIARSQGRKTDGRNKIPTPLDQLKELYALQQSGEVTVAEASKRMGLSRSVWYTRVRDMVSGSAVGA